jgi:hypothetical protein
MVSYDTLRDLLRIAKSPIDFQASPRLIPILHIKPEGISILTVDHLQPEKFHLGIIDGGKRSPGFITRKRAPDDFSSRTLSLILYMVLLHSPSR